MATAKIKMFGTGNFQIEDKLYVFKDGSEVEAKNAKHENILKSEAKRREANFLKLRTLEEIRKTEIQKVK